ncbi:hypothetical protein OG782_34450 [Streptomyces sp. NBC_00876]|uniref:hypothetical protein n=1 Tax=Streptomyces sp. NBC_00876 TaxID=2975853 RepID=UPI00386FF7D5|nr:hypothetical protein OG782_34450 [Streptomyces sp. NBC_00876]
MEEIRAAQQGCGEEDFTTRIRALGAFHAEHLADVAPYRLLARQAKVSPTTVSDWLRGERFPQDVAKLKVVVRALRTIALPLGILDDDAAARLLDEEGWARVHRAEAGRRADAVGHAVLRAQARAALSRGATADPAAPATGLLPVHAVRDAAPAARLPQSPPLPRSRPVEAWNPRHLGVKPAIEVPGAPGDLPLYIPRDHDRALRRTLRGMKAAGGMLLLVGEPSAGKSRSAHEAVRDELSDWWLLRPQDVAELQELARVTSTAPLPTAPGLILWLDDLDRFLCAHPALTAPTLVQLLDPRTPTIVVGALWPDQYDRHSDPGGADSEHDTRSAAPAARDILALAVTVDVAAEFSNSERERSQEIADKDPRIAAAMQVADFGVVQTLAGAPILERRWRHGNAYGRALITASVDARRLGAPELITPAFLRAAAPGYLDSASWARATGTWWDSGLRYATAPVDGATAALSPRAGSEPGSVVGYTLADHLLHVGTRRRDFEAVPDSAWRALLATSDSHDLVRIGWSAQWRLLYELADSFYAAAGAEGVLHRARLLRTRGRTAEYLAALESLAAEGNPEAVSQLITHVQRDLVQDDHETQIALLSPYADAHEQAADALADALASAGRHDEAIAVWTRLATGGDGEAARNAAEALLTAGRRDEALALLREGAGRDSGVRDNLVALLLDDGTANSAAEAERVLRAWSAENPDDFTCEQLRVDLLVAASRLDELEDMAVDGSEAARRFLTSHWREHAAENPGIVAHASAVCAAWKPSPYGPWAEMHLYEELGMVEAALDVALAFERDHGHNDDLDTVVASMLVDAGRWDELTARAETGNWRAQDRVALTLAEQGRIAEIEERAALGDLPARSYLSDHLEQSGRVDEAIALWRHAMAAGEDDGRRRLVSLLERHGRDVELLALLREETRPLGKYDARRLADLLGKAGRLAELADRAAAGDYYADAEVVNHLAESGHVDELCRRAVAGSGSATRALLYLADQEPEAAPGLRGLMEYGLRLDGTVAAPGEPGQDGVLCGFGSPA